MHRAYTLVYRLTVTGEWKFTRCRDIGHSRCTKCLRFGLCHTVNCTDDLLLYVGTLGTYIETNVSFVRNDVVFNTSVNKPYCDYSGNVACELMRTYRLQLHN